MRDLELNQMLLNKGKRRGKVNNNIDDDMDGEKIIDLKKIKTNDQET